MNIAEIINPAFGTAFAPFSLHMTIDLSGKTSDIKIVNFDENSINPANSSLHYGQSIFEGMKAYRQKDGEVGVFRPDLHATRFRNSARKMSMPDFPEDLFLKCIQIYVAKMKDYVPSTADHSLYLRPVMFSADNKLKVGAAQNYHFYILSCVVGDYFAAKGGMRPARVLVNPQYVRAFKGGLGDAKAAANYALSIPAQKKAEELNCDQVLYLDAEKHEFIDELGGMNFFAVTREELITPSLNTCILNGVTRRSLLELAPKFGLSAVEKQLSFTKLRSDIEANKVIEVFACGTAAVVNPIGSLLFINPNTQQAEEIKLSGNHDVALKLRAELQSIHTGNSDSFKDWISKI